MASTLEKTMRQPTIYEVLTAKLSREPTNEECREECLRIIAEAAGSAKRRPGKPAKISF